MDYASLKAASTYDELRDILADIKEGNTCVLIQSEHSNELKLDENINKIKEISNRLISHILARIRPNMIYGGRLEKHSCL